MLVDTDGENWTVHAEKFTVHYSRRRPRYFRLELETFSQDFLIPASCDSVNYRDVTEAELGFQWSRRLSEVEFVFSYRSNLWEKIYHLVVHSDHVELYYELIGSELITTLRFFEGTFADSYNPPLELTRHFNDRGVSPYRDNSCASPVSFKKVLNPEPNNFGKHLFEHFEYSQISVNGDLDYCGGNFIFNPGLLCFAICNDPSNEWLTLGIAVEPGKYLFSEYEYFGGTQFGLNLNYWGAQQINEKFKSPSVIMTSSSSYLEALKKYVEILRDKGTLPRYMSKPERWWLGPIICGWGHQSYMADLFRTRSPKDRPRDVATYYMCTQANYEDFVSAIDRRGLEWKILMIDSKWSINGGRKEVDEGRWPNLKEFVAHLHERGKKVLLWWGLWETEGLESEECITFSSKVAGSNMNRPGRFAKFGEVFDGKKIAPDPTLESFRYLIKNRLRNLLGSGEGCLNIDGLKIDHAAATPGLYGMEFPEGSRRLYGIELLKYHLGFLYRTAKQIKPDALITGQSPNPYFADCIDMQRLGDVYSGHENINEQMLFRRNMVNISDPNWLIDMDSWPMPSLKAFRDYMEIQPEYGVPSLYYATHLDTTGQPIPENYFHEIKKLWKSYLEAGFK